MGAVHGEGRSPSAPSDARLINLVFLPRTLWSVADYLGVQTAGVLADGLVHTVVPALGGSIRLDPRRQWVMGGDDALQQLILHHAAHVRQFRLGPKIPVFVRIRL